MRELTVLPSVPQSLPAKTARPSGRRRILWVCVAAWTIFAAFGLWWLLRGNAGPSFWVFNDSQGARSQVAVRFQGLIKADPGAQRVYPWLLLGPYVVLAIFRFPLERGRLRWSVPLNLATCVGFLAACHAIAVHTRVNVTNITFASAEGVHSGRETNGFSIRIIKVEPSKLLDLGTGARSLPRYPPEARLKGGAELPAGFKPPPGLPGLPGLSLWSSLLDLLAYGAIFGLAHSVHFYRRFREREHRTLLLESNLASAQLNSLRAQLQPHFLFNSLNAITTLLRREPRLAEDALVALSDLLRLALSQSERQEITLGEELQFVARYLEIQQTRFGERLRVERQIEPGAVECLVPALSLQPLVENALRHGIEPSENPGLVVLSAHRLNGKLLLAVEDNGVGLGGGMTRPVGEGQMDVSKPLMISLAPVSPGSRSSKGGTGIGLLNLRARLEALYGTAQKVEVGPRAGGGVAVRIEIPWHTRPAVESPVSVENA